MDFFFFLFLSIFLLSLSVQFLMHLSFMGAQCTLSYMRKRKFIIYCMYGSTLSYEVSSTSVESTPILEGGYMYHKYVIPPITKSVFCIWYFQKN